MNETVASACWQAMEMFDKASQTAVQMQQEWAKRWTQAMSQFGSPQQWPDTIQSIFHDGIEATKKNVEEAVRVADESAKRNLDLLQKALDLGRAGSTSEAQAKARGVWTSAMGAMQANAEAIVQANTRVFESWAELGKKLNGSLRNGHS